MGAPGLAEFIQDVTSLPMLDDWAKRFGSQRAVDPEEVGQESILASGGSQSRRQMGT